MPPNQHQQSNPKKTRPSEVKRAAKPLKRASRKIEESLRQRDAGRYVSQARLAEVLGLNRTTVREWQATGMPCVERGDGAVARHWVYDIAAVFAWRQEVVAAKVRADLASTAAVDDGEGIEMLKGLVGLDRITGIDKIIRLAERLRYLVDGRAVADIWAVTYRDIGQACMDAVDMTVRNLAGMPEEVVTSFVTIAKPSINAALQAAASSQAMQVGRLLAGEDDEIPEGVVDDEINT